jgi:hypothetical protein
MQDERKGRRACLLCLSALIAAPPTAAPAAETPGRRGPQGGAAPPATQATPPRKRPPTGEARRPGAANRAAAPHASNAVPPIDGSPQPSRRPGWDAAPVPNSNVQPPAAERRQTGPDVSFGVPTPPVVGEGQSFRANDPSPQARQQQQQQGGGLRLPSPGATVRVPF